ncbi:hypothetical protein SAMN05421823_112141 [Catalinimonas alkaloidigena]|uniref:Uncharacterized protein n=1 Tax=Catalinimonas alkaloidigena TaxID=1075417 RepID=A0A1G9SFK2_9BACT|nr:hypothetical protein SAMN05421823_112141 [Catalinimonas alkaloidigena]
MNTALSLQLIAVIFNLIAILSLCIGCWILLEILRQEGPKWFNKENMVQP